MTESDRLREAASILLTAVDRVMPEESPYGCPHSRRWLNSLLDDLREALEAAPSVPAQHGLDVERLARAMDPTAFEDLSHVRSTTTLTEGEWQALVVEVHLRRGRVMRRAADLAAEYARLSPVPVPPETEPSDA